MTKTQRGSPAKNGHRAGERARSPADVMRQAEGGVLALARTGLSLHLLVHLIDHPQPTPTDRVAKALEATIGIDD